MENYYEVTGISTASEIEKAYLTAVAQNKQFYRAISRKGTIYGWVNGHHKEAKAGQDWFENDQYVAPYDEIGEPLADEPIETAEPIEEVAEEVVENATTETEVGEPVVEEKVEEIAEEPAEEPIVEPQEPDYKSLYEETLKQVDVLEEELTEQDKLIEQLKNEVETISNAFAEYRAVIENFAKLFKE